MGVTSDYVYSRGYRGKVKALVLDWSGTTADAYVLAPAVVFVDVFKKHGVEHKFATIDGGEHGLGGGNKQQIAAAYEAVLPFVNRYMKR